VIYDAVPRGVRNVLELINALLIVVFLGLLTWAAMKVAMPAVAWQAWDCRMQFCGLETSAHAWDVPIPAYLKSVLFLAAVAMLAQSLVQLWQTVDAFFRQATS
jgi:TRAP-type C4-dicarboxylate transport system permease small subunit